MPSKSCRSPRRRSRDGTVSARHRRATPSAVGCQRRPHEADPQPAPTYRDGDVVRAYEAFFDDHLRFCVDAGIPAMPVDPGDFGPLARDADYERAWDRVVTPFRKHAERGADVGCALGLETGQIFVKPSEAVKPMNDVGHDNPQLMYDVAHVEATRRAPRQTRAVALSDAHAEGTPVDHVEAVTTERRSS